LGRASSPGSGSQKSENGDEQMAAWSGVGQATEVSRSGRRDTNDFQRGFE